MGEGLGDSDQTEEPRAGSGALSKLAMHYGQPQP